MRWAVVASILCACAPAGRIDEPPPEPADTLAELEPPVERCAAADPAIAPSVWPQCEQTSGHGSSQHPFVWEWSLDLVDHPCRYGCTMTTAAPHARAPGVTTTLHDDGDLGIRSAAPQMPWERRLRHTGFVPTRVRWTSWCGDTMVIAAHDERHVRLVALSSATGEVLDDFEEAIDGADAQPPALDVQLTCWDLRTAVHVHGRDAAWSIDMPRLDPEALPRRVAPEVVAALHQSHRGERHVDSGREVLRTRTRAYHRVGSEVFALDASGTPLWHREASDDWVGCLQGAQLIGAVACSGCPTHSVHLSLVGESVAIHVHGMRGSTDVFDPNGVHLAYTAP